MASPRAVGAGEGAAWIVAASPPSRDAALPSPVCSEVYHGGGDPPRFLVVSDLPHQGGARPYTQAIVDGVRHVLRQRGFETGGHTVGFQSCDASTAQSGDSDFFRCGSNAKAYARNLSVVGVVGSFHSPCSYLQIPIANEAAEGPLAMISPSNTYQELTENETRRGRRRGHPLPGVRCTHPRGAGRRRPEGGDPHPRRLRPVRRPRRSGRACREGMYVSQYGIPNAELPPRGREFLESFARSRSRPPGAGPDFAAAYGAQAAEILLDAIARSDGTRTSVTREVLRARVEDGILGDIRFDRNGDLVNAPFTFFRIVGGRSSEDRLHPTVDRVVVARSALLRAAG